MYFPSLQHCFKVQGFTNTLLGAIFGKRFNSSFFINKLLMQYICKELSKPMNFFLGRTCKGICFYTGTKILKSVNLFYLSLLNCMPYMLMCQRALRGYMLLCQSALHAYVLTCLRALCAYVLTCPRALHAYVLSAYVPCVRRCLPTSMSCLLTCSCASVPCVLACSCANVSCVLL